ncbi:MAG: hypothetical protein M0042_06020 [Nitrospiraceae bacterium]|nr:hypothetical protein [Nitrospiraceae bacterium]
MPKQIRMFGIMLLALVALLAIAVGCGGGDKGPVTPGVPLDQLFGGGTGTGGGGGIGGGGGGGTGACVASDQGFTYCVSGIDAATCANNNGQIHIGQTCQSLGYTNCQVVQGVTVCQ